MKGLLLQNKKFTLAHELGHYLLHKRKDFNKKEVYKRMEEEANYFASSFLMLDLFRGTY